MVEYNKVLYLLQSTNGCPFIGKGKGRKSRKGCPGLGAMGDCPYIANMKDCPNFKKISNCSYCPFFKNGKGCSFFA
jgi:hypothetical protein